VLDDERTEQSQIISFPMMPQVVDPERAAAQSQIRLLIEGAIDDLPEFFRIVFVMRDVEQMTVEESANFLLLEPATVKTRLHRARGLLRQTLDEQVASTLTEAFPFDGLRCAHIADKVMKRLAVENSSASY